MPRPSSADATACNLHYIAVDNGRPLYVYYNIHVSYRAGKPQRAKRCTGWCILYRHTYSAAILLRTTVQGIEIINARVNIISQRVAAALAITRDSSRVVVLCSGKLYSKTKSTSRSVQADIHEHNVLPLNHRFILYYLY